jgi:Peptidase family M1 domain/HEAT repeats
LKSGRLHFLLYVFVLAVSAPTAAAQSPGTDRSPGVARSPEEQDTPGSLFTAPIRESEVSPVDLKHIRLRLDLDPQRHTVKGELMVWFSAQNQDTLTWVLPGSSTVVDSVFIRGPESAFEVVIDSTAGGLRLDGINTGQEYEIVILFSVRDRLQSFPLGIESGDWQAIWIPSTPGHEAWLPLPSSMDDWFTSDMLVAVPDGWQVRLPGTTYPWMETGSGRIYRSEQTRPGSSGQLGFAAFREKSRQHPLADADTSRFSQFRNFLERHRLPSFPENVSMISTRDEAKVTGFDETLVFIPESIPGLPESGNIRSVLNQSVLADAWTGAYLRTRGWTDSWIQSAFSEYIRLLFLKSESSEVAYVERLWNLRNEYLTEAESYRRPLVWDRWNYPGQLLDHHAAAKGAWILAMLTERFGESVFWNVLTELTETAKKEPIDTETVRFAFERVTGVRLDRFFDQWVYGAGHPDLSFSYDVQEDQSHMNLSIVQNQSGEFVPSSFRIPLSVEAVSLVGVDSSDVDLKEPSQTFSLPISLRPQHVRVNRGGTILIDQSRSLSPVDLVSSLRRFHSTASRLIGVNLLERSRLEASLLLGLRPVWESTRSIILKKHLLRVFSRMAPSRSVLRIVLSAANDSSAVVRSSALRALASWPDTPESRKAAIDAANRDKDPAVLASAVETIVRLDPGMASSILQSALITKSERDIVRRTAFRLIPGFLDSSEAVRLLLPMLKEDNRNGLLPFSSRMELVRSLSELVENRSVRGALLELIYRSGSAVRSVLVQSLEQLNRTASLDSKTLERIATWSVYEPVPSLRDRLSSLSKR